MDQSIIARQFFNRLSVIETDARKVIETQEQTLRKLAGLRADMASYLADLETASPAPRVASAGIVAAPVHVAESE